MSNEPLPELPNYFDCESVSVSLHDCHDIITYAASEKRDTALTLYRHEFAPGELGRVTYTDVQLRSAPASDGVQLETTIVHTQPIKTPAIFSTDFVQRLIRRQKLKGGNVSSFLSERSIEATTLSSSSGVLTLRTTKGQLDPTRPDKTSLRNNLQLSTLIDRSSNPQQISDFFRIWGDSLDILSTYPLAQRSKLSSPKISIDIGRVAHTDASFDMLLWLESYATAAQKSGICLPAVDYDQLDVPTIAREIADDYAIFSAALAANALAARRTYGRTGIMRPLNTQSLMHAIQNVRASAEL